ncbi:MAG: ATP-binding cassette domain-containing protein, partial [Spirochaetes bacterium]|nr:ATP-binding cassette domain-containing protein [Spirochaetota bacterium]
MSADSIVPQSSVHVSIENLRKSFGTKQVLKDVSFAVKRGEILCVVGKSGTGKSVILKHLAGLMAPDSGRIFVDGEEFTAMTGDKRAACASKFGVLFQMGALFDSMNIYDNVAFGIRRKGISEDEISHIVPDLLSKVGLSGIEDKMPPELSGGMQKRAALARSLAMKPEIMLYDEPTTGVDPITGGSVDRLISEMNEKFAITSIVITHDM